MTDEDKTIPLTNVIKIDDERIRGHLDRVVRGTVEETLNALLDAEADRLCNAQRYERTEARRDTRVQLKAISVSVKSFMIGSQDRICLQFSLIILPSSVETESKSPKQISG